MSKILVIGDVHLNHIVADQILGLKEISFDEVVFLGDYFDHYVDSPDLSAATADWLNFYLKDSKFTFLCANHDCAYLYSTNKNLWCSGFDHDKCRAIFSKIDIHTLRDKLKYVHREGDFLFSHAGVSRTLLEYFQRKGYISGYENSAESVFNIIDCMVPELKNWNETGRIHSLVDAGYCRGGRAEVGGVIWNDFNDEFQPIKGIIQIFGHTPIYPNTFAVKLNKIKNDLFPKRAEIYYPEKDTREYDHLFENGCGIDIDSHLHGFAIVDTDERIVEIYKLNLDIPAKVQYYGRKITNVTKIWSRKF